jgi:hypothetical protein
MSSVNNYQGWVSLAPIQTEYDKVSKQATETFAQLNSLKPGDCK